MSEGNSFSIMKFILRHKIMFGVLFIVWIIGVIFTVIMMGGSSHTIIQLQHTSHSLIHPLQYNRLPPPNSFKMVKAMRYCNPPNDIALVQEGKVPVNYSLVFVAVVIRHGDRSPLRPVRNQSLIDCGTSRDYSLLRKYLTTLKSVQRHNKKHYPFTTFPLHPPERKCSSAQMTMVGSLQHIQLGYLMNKVYNNQHRLLKESWVPNDLKIYSTVYSRTYQSAIAFLFGFLPRFNFSNIKVWPTGNTRFCMTEYYCKCPLVENMQKAIDKKMQKLLVSHPAMVNLLQRLNPIVKLNPNHSDIASPMAMLDSVMGYVCHGSHLPCIPGTHQCVTIDHVRNLIAFLDWEGRQFVDDNTYKKASRLKMQGLFVDMLHHMQNSINEKGAPRFVLYSGHDITLIPLATALGFYDGSVPPYASRIVFEILRDNNPNSKHKHLIKIIYNGKDVTKYTSFCHSFFKAENVSKTPAHYFCPFERYAKFIEKDFFIYMNASSFGDACDASFSMPASSYDINHDSYREELE